MGLPTATHVRRTVSPSVTVTSGGGAITIAGGSALGGGERGGVSCQEFQKGWVTVFSYKSIFDF